MRLFYFLTWFLFDTIFSVVPVLYYFSNKCHAERNRSMFVKALKFCYYFKLKIANLYPSIPKPDNTASVLAAVTDF